MYDKKLALKRPKSNKQKCFQTDGPFLKKIISSLIALFLIFVLCVL